MATLRSLLSKGYFPRELPPPFNTLTFAPYAAKVGGSWKQSTRTRCVSHNLARPGGFRRPLRIPNPVSYFALADIVASNWPAIMAHTGKHRLSASRPYVLRRSDRAVVPRCRYAELTRLRALRRRAARYLLVTDIDQFYPTIYTHAIPWALHTKVASKAALKAKGAKGLPPLGDRLDKAFQCMNDGQTHGIPIGPDASLVAAEILLAAVGGRFQEYEKISNCPDGKARFSVPIFSVNEAAEDALIRLQAILAGFELLLNPRKTRLVELPVALDTAWSIELKAMDIRPRKSGLAQRNDILALFSRAFELAGEFPGDSVLRYAVSHVQGVNIHKNAWQAFHNVVLGAAAADASTLAVAFGTLEKVAKRGKHAVPQAPLTEVLETVIARHAPRAQGSEVAWALWGALAWNLSLSAGAAQAVSAMEDDVVALLALHADARGLFPSNSLNTALWSASTSDPNALVAEHWLLAYEADRQGWLQCPAVASDPVFASFRKARVTFYDTKKITPHFPAAARGLPGGTLWAEYA